MSVEVGQVCGDGPSPTIDVWILFLAIVFALYIIVDSGITALVLFRGRKA